ncbi:serine/threonine protein kinase [Lentzea sp. PSKA42]|uniref:non-specific serine/threonine protein kinase n=1 Tax=Lentzea indica TaxID=2604800 RepID=A0ABX1FTP8_9PSEU|nr:serine/threonine-protein kinase [Lentzea indica]NKE62410.1 serine/threonine protein kinase [Lentzea indica]
MTEQGDLIAGRYRLQRRIGSGGMGVVWQAFDERLDRVVALKHLVLPPGLSTEEAERARQRAVREARIAARLQHPGAVTVHDVTEDGDRPVLVMEYVPARSLAELIATRGPLSGVQVAQIGGQVAAALAAAHQAGIVHRDVKPANVLITDTGTAKITDFGIARAHGDTTITATGLVVGTPAFLAPEVAQGHEPSAASDVFSLGATLYTAVEGRAPFGDGDNAIALLHAVAAGQMIPPAHHGPITDVVLHMMRADPAARPAMAQTAERSARGRGWSPSAGPDSRGPAAGRRSISRGISPVALRTADRGGRDRRRRAHRAAVPAVHLLRPGRQPATCANDQHRRRSATATGRGRLLRPAPRPHRRGVDTAESGHAGTGERAVREGVE